MHFEWGPLLNFFLIHVVGHVFESMAEASLGCPWVGQNEKEKRQKWEGNRNIFITKFCTNIYLP
jgi:hypothetical protein